MKISVNKLLVRTALFERLAVRRHEEEGISSEEVKEQSTNFVQSKNIMDDLRPLVSDKTDPNYYMRFSNVPVATINPAFEFTSILGIYAHPLTQEKLNKLIGTGSNKLQMQNKNHLLVFSPKDKTKILNFHSYTYDKFTSDLKKFYHIVNQKIPLDQKDYKELFDISFHDGWSLREAMQSFGDHLERKYGKEPFPNKKSYQSSLPYRLVGYQGIYYDDAVFFSGAYINEPIVFDNKYQTKK